MRIINYLDLLSAIIGRRRFIYAHFGLTHRCNLKCRMCDIWRLADKTHELTLDEIKILADILKSLGVIVISIGGGEPFLRKDIKEIIKIFIQRGLMVRLLTNGTIIKEDTLKELVKVRLRHISVSLDTVSAAKQSYICNQEGIGNKIVENMALISKVFPKRRSLLLVNTTVSKLNLEELPNLARFTSKLGYYISYIPLEPAGAGHCGSYHDDYPMEFNITPEDYKMVDEIYGELIKMKRQDSNIFNSTRFLEDSRRFLKMEQRDWRCDAGKLYFSLSPQGNFSICHHFQSERRFNDSIGSYLRSEEFRLNRKRLIEGCPGCMRPCWAEITHLANDRASLWEMSKMQLSIARKGRIFISKNED